MGRVEPENEFWSKSVKPYVLLLDINAPWVQSLMTALPGVREGSMELHAWRIFGLGYWMRNRARIALSQSQAPEPADLRERTVLVPGWTRFYRLSTALLGLCVRRHIASRGSPEAIIYTLPQYTGVAARFTNCFQAYYAYDPYRYYGWEAERIDALETSMLRFCNLAFGISRLLVTDLQKRSDKPVFYSPNAVSAEFIEQLRSCDLPPPDDLADIHGKIVGCIGQLSRAAYDWPLIDALVQRFPDVTFVFVGGLLDSSPEEQVKLEKTLRKPNVCWVGRKPHSELPRYLRRFDVCFNPLAVTEHNDRRSLLRLYDYLAAEKPILSTAIKEAQEHKGFVQIGRNPDECTDLLGKMLASGCHGDAEARRAYILQNTWNSRAAQFWSRIAEAKATFERSPRDQAAVRDGCALPEAVV